MTRRSFHRCIFQLPAVGMVVKYRANAADVHGVVGTMLDRARFYLKAADWAPRRPFGPFKEAYYCNLFVADVAREAGAATWDPISRPVIALPDRDPVAREWADPQFAIKGWMTVFHSGTPFGQNSAQQMLSQRKPGDVVSGAGHVGIVSDDPRGSTGRTFSASANTGAVEHTDWSFRLPDTAIFKSAVEWETAAKSYVRRFTVRRFVGV